MDKKVARAEKLIAEIAKNQHGVVSLAQMRDAGLSDTTIRRRDKRARLHRVHRGVYAVGHSALSPEGRCIAAILALGGGPAGGGSVLDHWGAAVSHRSAAVHWGLLPTTDGPVDVLVKGGGGRAKRRGIRVHRSNTLLHADLTIRHGIPITKPARTISDLRRATAEGRPGAITARDLRKAIRQADVLGFPIDESDMDRTRSDLEQDFLWLCRRHRIPSPEVNVRIGPYLVDFLWRDRRFVVETDSYLYHRGEQAFQDDRSRDLELRRRGYDVLRLSERQIDEEPDQVAETVMGSP